MATTDHHWSLHIDHHLASLSMMVTISIFQCSILWLQSKIEFFFYFFGEMKWKWKKIELLSFWFDSRELILIKILLFCFFPTQTKSESCCFFHSFTRVIIINTNVCPCQIRCYCYCDYYVSTTVHGPLSTNIILSLTYCSFCFY